MLLEKKKFTRTSSDDRQTLNHKGHRYYITGVLFFNYYPGEAIFIGVLYIYFVVNLLYV